MTSVSVSSSAHCERANAIFVDGELKRFGVPVDVLRHRPVRTGTVRPNALIKFFRSKGFKPQLHEFDGA